MAKRYIKQQHRSYHYGGSWKPKDEFDYISNFEIKQHVVNAKRPNADPLFNEIAHEAAMNGLCKLYCGEQGVCFLQPTDNPHGYFSLLKLISKKKMMFRSEIEDEWKCKPYTTLVRLIDGKLLDFADAKNPKTKRPAHLYSLSKLGELYLQVAEKYVVKRQTKKKQFS